MKQDFQLPFKGRHQSRTTLEGLEIKIPAPMNSISMIFICVWLAGWSFAGYAVISSLLEYDIGIGWKNNSPPKGPLAYFWLCGWAIGWCWAVYHTLWTLFGFEKIILKRDALIHEWRLLLFGKAKKYDLTRIERLRVAAAPSLKVRGQGQRAEMSAGSIAFDYGLGTVVMAKSIDPGEANGILTQLLRANPDLQSSRSPEDKFLQQY